MTPFNYRELWNLLRDTISAWIEDRAPRKGAALAFYTLFSLAPVLIIVIAIVGAVYGEEAARGEIVEQIDGLVGEEGAIAVQGLIDGARDVGSGFIATLFALVTMIIGATTVFAELKDSLDQIWRVEPETSSGLWNFLRARLVSFGLILVIGFLLLVSLALSAALAAFSKYWGGFFSGTVYLLHLLNFLISFVMVTGLFASIYKLLPKPKIDWKDVWIGAAITALLFTIGKSLIGLYLGQSAIGSTYGAAGSLIVVLLWVYYSAQIFFLGAEFTKLYASRYGSRRAS